jgi:hypothetical protein
MNSAWYKHLFHGRRQAIFQPSDYAGSVRSVLVSLSVPGEVHVRFAITSDAGAPIMTVFA